MAQPINRDPETREQWLGRAIEMMRPEFVAAGATLPEDLAGSCSWPSGNPRTVIGECWVAEASSRGYVGPSTNGDCNFVGFGVDNGRYLTGWGGGGEEAIAAIKACGDRIAGGARRILELLEETG
jgi:hypothetical protein